MRRSEFSLKEFLKKKGLLIFGLSALLIGLAFSEPYLFFMGIGLLIADLWWTDYRV